LKGQLTVQGITWDQYLGGKQFDRRLALHFAKKVKEQIGKDITNDVKVMAKLYKEAQKTKEVLSANNAARAQVCSIYFYYYSFN
jgi:molecular chaperone DnaK (HSP70)